MVLGRNLVRLTNSNMTSPGGESSEVWRNALGDVIESPSRTPSNAYPVAQDEISDFGDNDCGEPTRAQHLVIDFTLDPNVDSPEAQLKCSEFWEFINSKDYLQHLCVSPKVDVPVTQTKPTAATPDVAIPLGVTVLEGNSKDFMGNVLCEKVPQTNCSLGRSSYSIPQEDSATKVKIDKTPGRLCVCVCPEICKKCTKIKSKTSNSEKRTKALCKVLDDWDKTHPKSMEPPTPVMQYRPELQRKPPPPQNLRSCFD